jgi:cell division protein ZapA (FtsZ GTPase activity inhibitor)
MPASKHRRMISLSEEADEYLHKHMKERGYRFPGDAIADIIRKYERLKNNEPDETFLDAATIDAIGQAYLKRASGFYQYLDDELSEIKETTKNTQIDARVLMELVNNLYDHLNIQKFKSTQFGETEATKKAKRVALHKIQEEKMQFREKRKREAAEEMDHLFED